MSIIGLSDQKQKTTQTQQSQARNEYGWQAPPDSPDLNKLRDAKFEIDPGIPAQFGRERQQLEHGFNQPAGAYYPTQVKDAILRSGNERIGQQEAQAMREGQFDVNKLNFARDSAVAGMTRPVLTQTGSTSSGSGTGTATQSQSPYGTIASVGAQFAPLSL